jgi:hypothetical protein
MVYARIICGMFFVAVLTPLFSINAIAATPVRCFSDMTYHKVEGDYVGFNICLVEHRGGMSVIFQEAAGFLEAPILIEGQVRKDKLSFELPAMALTPGIWKADIERARMVITNPAGNVYRLKQKTGW